MTDAARSFAVVRLRVERGAGTAARDAFADRWALFAPQIGDTSESLVLVVPAGSGSVGSSSPPGITVESIDQVTATVRPTTAEPLPADDGVWALRWFDIDPSDWDEFLALSEGAWPGFEAANPGTRIHGFFRTGADGERVLLVTRYPSLAMWETSRGVDDEGGRANFRRRHELTKSTIVRTYRLIA